MSNKHKRLTRVLLTALLVVAALVAAVAASATWFVNTELPQYRSRIAARLGTALNADVTIDNLGLQWRWSGPIVRLSGVHITRQQPQRAELYIPAADAGFSLTDLATGHWLPGDVVIHDPRIKAVVDATQWHESAPAVAKPNNDFIRPLPDRMRKVLDNITIASARIDITLITMAGRQRIRLRKVDATLNNSGDTLVLSASAQAEPWLDTLQLKARIDGPLQHPDTAHLTLHVDNLSSLALWQQAAASPVTDTLTGGSIDFRLDSSWRAGRFTQATLHMNVDAIHRRQSNDTLVPSFDARFKATADPKQAGIIRASLSSLDGAVPTLKPIRMSARIDTADGTMTVRARKIAASLLGPLLLHATNMSAPTQLTGTIEAAAITLTTDAAIQAAVAFHKLRLSTPRFAVGPVSGHYYRNGKHNIIRFTDAGGSVRVQRYLQGALPVSDLDGQLSWESTADTLQFQATDLTLTSGASAMTLDGQLTLRDKGAPIADLSTHITTPDCSLLLAHVPQARDMPFDDLREWLPKAVASCDVTVDGYLVGPLDQMFAEQGKHLGITVTGSDFAMEYKPGWPLLTNATGAIRLQGATMDIDISQSQMLGVSVDAIKMRVEDVRDPVLFVDGVITGGSASKMLSILAKSPLRERFGKLAEVLDVGGNAGLDLSLRLPLRDDLGQTTVAGVIHTQGNSVSHATLPAPIKAVRGDIHFSDKGLRAKELHGELMDVALTARIVPAAANRIDIVSHGHIRLPRDKALLANYVPERGLALAHGDTPVKVQLQIDTSGRISDLSLHSDLIGMALALPEPLGKPANTARPFDIRVKDKGRVTLTYGDAVHVGMHLDEQRLTRAVIKLGAGPAPAAPAGPGIWIGGHVDTVPVNAWLHLLQRPTKPDKVSPTGQDAIPFLGADVRINTLRIGSRELHDLDIKVESRNAAPGWTIIVNGTDAAGRATWQPDTDGRGVVHARLARLHIRTMQPATTTTTAAAPAKAKTDSEPSSTLVDIDPKQLPTMNVTIDQLQVGSTQFGTAVIEASAIDDGWQLHGLALSGGKLTLHAQGRWTRHVGLTEASLDIAIDGQGLAELTRALGFDPAIKAQKVSVRGTLNVTPNDHGINLAAVNGKLSLGLTDGSIESIEPGAGRLLGLLNLYALPRRLALDFSDVVSEGLAFDKISGDFKIISGDAFTDNLVIQTPAAKIRVVGRIGLATREYDETVTVTPKIGSSLTLAGTVLGGPIVGAAIFALQELFETPLQNASSISYQLQGTWGDPKIINPRAHQ